MSSSPQPSLTLSRIFWYCCLSLLLALLQQQQQCHVRAEGGIPDPTGFGTLACKKWPKFELQDYNPSIHATYLQTYGLADIQPQADVTIVGLYFADSAESQAAIQWQERVGYNLQDLTVHNVAINYYAPKSCAEEVCEDEWSFGLFKPKKIVDCSTYIAGCKPTDSRLEVDNWQAKLYNVTKMPILQDSYWVDAWERFGGGEGDIFIYDSEGRLYTVFCTAAHAEFMPLCTNIYSKEAGKENEMLTKDMYKTVKSAAQKAGTTDSAKRCKDFDDEYYGGYKDQYYYYYYGDDVPVEDDDDSVAQAGEGDATGTTTIVHSVDDDDDDSMDDDFEYKHSSFHLGFRNELNKVEGKSKTRGAIPIAAYASVLAVSVLLVSVVVIWLRWSKAKAMLVMASRAHSGSTKFSRLSTTDDDQSHFRNMLREDESSYGSL